MRRIRATATIALTCTLAMTACVRSSTPALRDADTIALKEYEARHLPGMSMIILKGDDTLFEQGVGAVPVTRRRQSADGPDLACDQPKNQPCTLNTA